jgi:hypothetical protein
MRIYVASSHPRFSEAAALAAALREAGHEVTSNWHDQPEKEGYQTQADGRELVQPEDNGKDMHVEAERDFQEVVSANVYVGITGDDLTHGGRHTELGIALASGLFVGIFGPREQIFHFHPSVQVLPTQEGLLEWLESLEPVELDLVPEG